MKSFFINEAFDKAIKDYNSSKSSPEGVLYNSFLVMVIRMLVSIYNEADIINPSIVNNENAFDNNLMKYGASKEDVDKLKRYLDGYYLIEKRNKSSVRREDNIYFVEVQKLLIDLFNIKRLNYDVSDNKVKEFFNLLYTPGTSNVLRLSYNYLNAENIYEVAEYYNEKMKIKKEDKKEEKDLLAFDVYKKFNVSVKELSKMNNGEISTFIERMEEIGDSAFMDCVALQEVSLPQGVRFVEPATFMGCKSLQTVTLTKSIERLQKNAFKGCKRLTKIVCPKKYPPIIDEAFDSYDVTVYVPAGLQNKYFSDKFWKFFKDVKESI